MEVVHIDDFIGAETANIFGNFISEIHLAIWGMEIWNFCLLSYLELRDYFHQIKACVPTVACSELLRMSVKLCTFLNGSNNGTISSVLNIKHVQARQTAAILIAINGPCTARHQPPAIDKNKQNKTKQKTAQSFVRPIQSFILLF